MTRWTIDTNVPVVANGRGNGGRPVAPACREAAVDFLMRVLDQRERVVLDEEGAIQKEYRRNLRPSGQPGVGDRFYQAALQQGRCEWVSLLRRRDGEYADLPQAVIDAGFDRDDRKFAALARREGIPVVNAVDGDWLAARQLLASNSIRVKFLCGRNRARWFAARA